MRVTRAQLLSSALKTLVPTRRIRRGASRDTHTAFRSFYGRGLAALLRRLTGFVFRSLSLLSIVPTRARAAPGWWKRLGGRPSANSSGEWSRGNGTSKTFLEQPYVAIEVRKDRYLRIPGPVVPLARSITGQTFHLNLLLSWMETHQLALQVAPANSGLFSHSALMSDFATGPEKVCCKTV